MTLGGIHHSTGQDCWATPQDFYDRCAIRWDFTLDACAEPWSAKCARYYTRDDDGLASPWSSWTWCNPPYSQLAQWLAKAAEEHARGVSSVLLTFARTDTKAFHAYAMRASEIVFVEGRLSFLSPDVKAKRNSAPSPSILIVFDAEHRGQTAFSAMKAR